MGKKKKMIMWAVAVVLAFVPFLDWYTSSVGDLDSSSEINMTL